MHPDATAAPGPLVPPPRPASAPLIPSPRPVPEQETTDLGPADLGPADLGPADLGPAELLDTARRSVHRARARRATPAWVRGDDDDLVGDVVEACLRARRRGQTVHAGYVDGVARHLVGRDRDLSSADARALRLLQAATAEREQELGRSATDRDRCELAGRILAGWSSGRRPSRSFHRRTEVVPADLETHAVAGEPARAEHTDDAAVLALLDACTRAHGKAERFAIRRRTWDALADVTGAPKVSADLSKHRVTAARALMRRRAGGTAAGVRDAVAAWEQGEADARTEALFLPWAALDRSEQAAVVDQLRRYAAHAGDLWESALACAGRTYGA